MKQGAFAAVLMAATVLFGAAPVWAQSNQGPSQNDYVIGVDDVLNVAVWQRDDLSRTVAVRATGKITFPPVGDIQASGVTTSQLAQTLEDDLYAYTRQRPEVTVTIVAFNSRKVFITGQVAQPGRYAFEQIPGLAEVLGIAGGALPGADLSQVRIVRTSGGTTQSIRVDLQNYLGGGQLGNIPALQPGDLIYVPGAFGNTQGGGVVAGEGSVVYVFGQVARPGAYPVTGSANLVEILALAGGTTPVANLKDIQVVTHQETGGVVVADVDLEAYFRKGESDGFPVRAGDAINVPARGKGVAGMAWSATGQVLGLSRDVLDLVLIRDYLKKQ